MHLSKDATVEEMDTRQDSVSVPVKVTSEITVPGKAVETTLKLYTQIVSYVICSNA